MKLYATVASERAMKGQGGKELDIVVHNESKQPVIAIKLVVDICGRTHATITRDMRYSEVHIDWNTGFLEEKGEKKKDEHRCVTLDEQRKCAYGK